MGRHCTIACTLAILGVVLWWSPAEASQQAMSVARHAQGAGDLSAQARPRGQRPRIRVTPGRLLYRDCISWIEREWRPSGTVIVPRLRCWWVRG